jgi:hypothetical protein
MKRTVAALSAAAVSTVALIAGISITPIPAGADPATDLVYTSPTVTLIPSFPGVCTTRLVVRDPNRGPAIAFTFELRAKALFLDVPPVLGSGTVAGGSTFTYTSPQVGGLSNGDYWFEVRTPARIVPRLDVTCPDRITVHNESEWTATNAYGSPAENDRRANGLLSALTASLDAARAAIAAAQTKLDTINAKVGNRTRSVCVGGSVRNELSNRSQLYLTLFNPATVGVALPVTVVYSTNRGQIVRTYAIALNRQQQIDVNAALTGPRAPYQGMTDVDTAITVTTNGAPVHMGCTMYFSKSAGIAGFMSGVTDLPVTTN